MLHVNYYLIDYENIHTEMMRLLNDIKVNSTIYIFYSDNSGPISQEIISKCEQKNLILKGQKVRLTGKKNALDFQLASYLGHIISNGDDGAMYNIISNDKGFDCLCEFWEGFDVRVNRIGIQKEDCKVKTKNKKERKKKNHATTIDELKMYMSEANEAEVILKIINNYKLKKDICNQILKYYRDSKRGSAVYRNIKPLLRDKNKK